VSWEVHSDCQGGRAHDELDATAPKSGFDAVSIGIIQASMMHCDANRDHSVELLVFVMFGGTVWSVSGRCPFGVSRRESHLLEICHGRRERLLRHSMYLLRMLSAM
jgi:hypothetical protein